MGFKENVAGIIKNIGGAGNVSSASHCVTRLRLVLVDESLVDKEALEENELVKGTFSASGQFQVIIGPGMVEKVYSEFVQQTGAEAVSKDDMKKEVAEKGNVIQKGVRVLADIFIPILPAIVAAGLLLGLNNMLANPGIFYDEKSLLDVHTGWTGIAEFINVIANTAFTFLPVLIAWSAAKKFGGSPLLGIVLGLLLVHPSLMSAYAYAGNPGDVEYWNLFGWDIAKIGYQGQVLPVIFATWILTWSERQLKRYIHDNLQMIFVAPLALVFAGLLTFGVIGPITMTGSNWITDGILYLFEVSPAFAGAVYGFISGPLVITGMHHIFLGVNLQMAGTLGYVTLWPIGETVTLAQGAAALTMFFIIKQNKKLKGVSLTATLSAWLGVTEPAIYGINLRFRYPFIAVMIGSAVGSAYLAAQGVKATSVGVGGMLSFLSVYPEHWAFYFTGMAITFVITVGLTFGFFKSNFFKAGKTADGKAGAESGAGVKGEKKLKAENASV
jgi:trehalose PTS system EIIBC or EIIBCA component